MLTAFIEFIRNLIEKKFYGEVVVKFEHGKIVIIKKTESVKL